MSEVDSRNVRGDLGEGTVGSRLKSRWHKEGKGLSLKQFARKLVASGDKLAQDWFDSKRGLMNQSRTDKNKQRLLLEKQATKASRRKGK